ncbi:MAG: regulatory protein RecX [bacterium]
MEYPAEITKITVQKKNKNRSAIFLNHEFAFGLDSALVAKFDLKEGDQLTKEQVANIRFKEEGRRIKEKAYRYLAGRAHSEKELRIKLQQKGYDHKLVEEVISDLKGVSLIDDLAFALSYAHSRLINRPVGEKLLRSELWHKGVSQEIIDKAVHETYAEKNQLQIARELVDKRKSHYPSLESWKEKKRIADFLIRRGFDWELVKEVIAEKFENQTD